MSISADRRQGGFTLVEMLVVLAIAGMIGALTFPRLDQLMGRLELRRASGRLANDIAAARALARRTGEATRIMPADTLAAPFRALGPLAIAFFPDGSSSGGTIVLEGRGQRLALHIDPATGRAAEATP